MHLPLFNTKEVVQASITMGNKKYSPSIQVTVYSFLRYQNKRSFEKEDLEGGGKKRGCGGFPQKGQKKRAKLGYIKFIVL